MTSPQRPHGARPEVGIDVQPRLLSGALCRVLAQKGWTVVDLCDEPDHRVDILLVSDEGGEAPAPSEDAVVIVLPGSNDGAAVARYSNGTHKRFAEGGNPLEELLALLSSDSP